jgi:Flp pilus assembly protein TadG
MTELRRNWRVDLRRLAGDQRGAVMAIVGLAIIPLFAVIGLSIDSGRGYMLKSKLSYAIDAAGLAGGRAFETDLREADIAMFFEANFPTGYMGSVLAPGHPLVTFNDEENTITIEATATIPTHFMSVAGVHEMSVSARTVIRRELQGMELVLVMDNTGSMRSGGKIDAMKDAARKLVDVLYGSRDEVENFYVGLVPYAATVNIGSDHTDWLTGYDADDFAPTTWKGCVEAREYPNDSNDLTADEEAWRPFLWESTRRKYWSNGHYGPSTSNPAVQDGNGDGLDDDGNPFPLGGDNEWDPAGPESALKLDNDLYQNTGTGPNLGCPPAITPLITSKSDVLDAIDDMGPWHRGGTMANLGLAWGWRVLSPSWRDLWGGGSPEGLPLDYHTPNMHKVIILLTDGNNEWYDWPGTNDSNCGDKSPKMGLPGQNSYGSSVCNTYAGYCPGADYTAYGRLNEGRLDTTNKAAATAVINDRMLELCSAMKEQDIIMYTITFQVSNTTTQNLYRSCATDNDHYFNSPTNSQLDEAFEQIADELSNLRIAE